MENISRELAREIAQSKPKPFKQERNTRVLIVDDFGQMKSGEHLKKLALISGGVAILFFIALVVVYQLYSTLSKESKQIRSDLEIATKKVSELTREKEMLMARLVIQGKRPDTKTNEPLDVTMESGESEPVAEKKALAKPKPLTAKEAAEPVKEDGLKPEPVTSEADEPVSTPVQKHEPVQVVSQKNLSIEKFTVRKDNASGDLLVRFDIRNISKTSGDVSGRIFTILKPDNDVQSRWLVVPSASLNDGVPVEYRKGQYFSIAHFKPVKFRVKNRSNPDTFKKASIYIFDSKGKIIFEKMIDVTEGN